MVEDITDRSAFDAADGGKESTTAGESRPIGLRVVALGVLLAVFEFGHGLLSADNGFTGLGGSDAFAAFGIGLWGLLHLTIGAFCLRGSVRVWRFERRGRRRLLGIGKVYGGLLLLAILLSPPAVPWIGALLAAILSAWGFIVVYLWDRKGMFAPART